MVYATVDDVILRSRRELSEKEKRTCDALLEDAAVIIDSYNVAAPVEAKKIATCNMVIRAIGDGNNSQFPIGATQCTVSALGYSQAFTMGNGSTGELFLTKLEKKILGSGKKIGFISAFEVDDD